MSPTRHTGVCIAAITLGTDQMAKALVRRFLLPCQHAPSAACDQIRFGAHVAVLNLQNRGSAFGFSQGVWIWTALAMAGLMLVATIDRRSGSSLQAVVAVGLLAGGAAGNLLDRLAFGGVTDFLGFRWGVHGGLVINLADVALAIGAILAARATSRHADLDQQPLASEA